MKAKGQSTPTDLFRADSIFVMNQWVPSGPDSVLVRKYLDVRRPETLISMRSYKPALLDCD